MAKYIIIKKYSSSFKCVVWWAQRLYFGIIRGEYIIETCSIKSADECENKLRKCLEIENKKDGIVKEIII